MTALVFLSSQWLRWLDETDVCSANTCMVVQDDAMSGWCSGAPALYRFSANQRVVAIIIGMFNVFVFVFLFWWGWAAGRWAGHWALVTGTGTLGRASLSCHFLAHTKEQTFLSREPGPLECNHRRSLPCAQLRLLPATWCPSP